MEMASTDGTQVREGRVYATQMSGQAVEIAVEVDGVAPGRTFPDMLIMTNEDAKALLVALARLLA